MYKHVYVLSYKGVCIYTFVSQQMVYPMETKAKGVIHFARLFYVALKGIILGSSPASLLVAVFLFWVTDSSYFHVQL